MHERDGAEGRLATRGACQRESGRRIEGHPLDRGQLHEEIVGVLSVD
jgi:hypothetical protein